MSVVFMLFVKLSVFFVHYSFACSLFLTGFQESKYLGGGHPFGRLYIFPQFLFCLLFCL